jgi:plastocyanin
MLRTIRRLGPAAAGLLVTCLALSACGAVAKAEPAPAAPATMNLPDMTAAGSASSATVTIAKFMFGPDTLKVPVGATVTWTNQDDDPHTVVAKDGSFRSGALNKGASYRHTFDKAGTYQYLCSIHPFMVATVVVAP